MLDNNYVAKAFLKIGCPYSFKFYLFMAESDLMEQIEVVPCDPGDIDFYAQVKAMIKTVTGVETTFPVVEIEPAVYLADSEGLIDYYAKKNGLSDTNPPTLAFYRRSIYPRMIEMKQEIFDLKERLGQ